MRNVAEIKKEIETTRQTIRALEDRARELQLELSQATIVAWVGWVDNYNPTQRGIETASTEEWWNRDFGVGEDGEVHPVWQSPYEDTTPHHLEDEVVVGVEPTRVFVWGMETSAWCARFNTEAEARQWADSFVPPPEE